MSVIARVMVLIGLMSFFSGVAGAAPFGTRFFVDVPAVASSASRFPLSVELYDLATGLRVTTNGVSITLNLLRCPGFPSSCTPVVITPGFASGNTVSGVVNFTNIRIADANTDYYFSATATSYNTARQMSSTSTRRSFGLARFPDRQCPRLRDFGLIASIRRGTQPADPIDRWPPAFQSGLACCPV